MDIVYLHRSQGEDRELRYSLRSLVNVPHKRVWVFGTKPEWMDAHWVPVHQRNNRFTNTTRALKAACEHRGVSDPFILMNDDFYVMSPLEEVATLTLGPLAVVAEGYKQRPGNQHSSYVSEMEATDEMLRSIGIERPLSYDSHTPLVVDKALMLEAIRLCEDAGLRGAHKRSVYGNLAFKGGLVVEDVKVYNETCPIPTGTFLSSLDSQFDRVEGILKATFPEPCRYETDAGKPSLTVVITNHNYSKYLPRCIDSALTYADEVLVYDDGSTDDSMDILRDYGDAISVTHRPTASGDPVWGSNLGIHDATGTHLIFLDADNYLTARPPTGGADYTFADITVEGGGAGKRWSFAGWPLTADECWAAFEARAVNNTKPVMPFPWGGVWRTSFLKGKRWRRFQSTAYAADCRTALDWCKARPSLAYSPEPFMVFVKHAGQWSGSPERSKMLAEAAEIAVVETMPGGVRPPPQPIGYPVTISRAKQPFEYNGKTYNPGDKLDRDTAVALRAAGFLTDPRIV